MLVVTSYVCLGISTGPIEWTRRRLLEVAVVGAELLERVRGPNRLSRSVSYRRALALIWFCPP